MPSNLPFGFEEEEPFESLALKEPDDDQDEEEYLIEERPYTEPEE